jgi:hypothetical protein
MPLAVSDLSQRFISALPPILVVQFLKVSDLVAETPDLFPKHCKMIHTHKNSSSRPIAVRCHPVRELGVYPRLRSALQSGPRFDAKTVSDCARFPSGSDGIAKNLRVTCRGIEVTVEGRHICQFPRSVESSPLGGSFVSSTYRCCRSNHHVRAMHGTGEPFTRLRLGVRVFLSSTWGRADQQTPRDSNRVWGVLFSDRKSLFLSPFPTAPLPPHSRAHGRLLPTPVSMVVDLFAH